MTFLTIFLLILGGILCGVVNVIGGGGSLLALPILMSLGLPANVANGTNRIAIICQDASSLLTFRKQHISPWKESFKISLPVILGALAGAWVATQFLSETLMNILILILVLFMIMLIVFKKNAWSNVSGTKVNFKMTLSTFLLFLATGFYGGFIQAGFTYLVMAALILKIGNNMITSDAIKMFVNLLITPFALFVFIYHNQVDWSYGFIMGIGGVIGGYLGSRFVVKWNPVLIRWILLILLALSGLYIVFFRMIRF